jgi:hypothetical protein
MNAKRIYELWILILAGLLLTGCGGGGGGGVASTQAKDVAGVYTGTDDSSTALTVVIRPDGDYWFFYTPSGDSLQGVVTGNGTAKGDPDYTFKDSDGKDFQEGASEQPIVTSDIETTYVSETSLSGTESENGTTQSTFALDYQSTVVTLDDLAGDFTGGLVAAGASQAVIVTFQSDGSFSGSVDGGGPSYCGFTGTASVQDDTHYKITVHVDADVTDCSDASGQAGSGIAYLNPTTNELYMFFKSSGDSFNGLFDLTPGSS